MTQFISPTWHTGTLRPAWSIWWPRQPLTPQRTSRAAPDWSRSLPGLGRWRWPTQHRAGSSVSPSREAGAGEPLVEALEAAGVSEAGRLHIAVGPPAGSHTRRQWISEKKGSKKVVISKKRCRLPIMFVCFNSFITYECSEVCSPVMIYLSLMCTCFKLTYT